jgi:hypothetical protein
VVTGLALVVAPVIIALLGALAFRFESLVSTLLAAYLLAVGNVVLVALVLSPFRAVDRGGLAAAEAVLLVGTGIVWWKRGRPWPPLAGARAAISEIVSNPVTLLFFAAVAVLLGYELVLGLTVPPNNWDSLTYHLARVAAWIHHGGYYWIPDAPDDRLNEFQPVAEQQLLYLFVASGSDQLYAAPQFVAELAILVAVYGAGRRLGFGVSAAASSVFLLATFTLFVLESSTAQNDLVAASFPAVAACLLLAGGRVEAMLAGAAAGIGLGAKLTTGLVWPTLLWLALLRGRRIALPAAAGAFLGIAAIGNWGYLMNLTHTGAVLGHGGGRVEHSASPSYPGSLVTALSILYMMMDLASLNPAEIAALTIGGLVAAGIIAALASRRFGVRRALTDSFSIGVPFLSPAAVIVVAGGLAYLTRLLGTPVKGPGGTVSSETSFFGGLNNTADESESYFGPIGGVLMLAIPFLVAFEYLRRRLDPRGLALACALPIFLVALALQSQFDLWLGRFLIIPVALTAPLFGQIFRNRGSTAAYLSAGVLVAALAITHDTTKSLESPLGRPWNLTPTQAVVAAQMPAAAHGAAALDHAVPAHSCLGAVLGIEDPVYLTNGPNFGRHVIFLPATSPVAAANNEHLHQVVITRAEARTANQRQAAHRFAAAGWTLQPLADFWWLATSPTPSTRNCN